MKKIVIIMTLVLGFLFPIIGNAKINYDYDFRIDDKIFIFEENDIYYFLDFENLNIETSKYYLYDKNGNYLGEELIFDPDKMTRDEFLHSKRCKSLIKVDQFRSDVIFNEEDNKFYQVRYDSGEFHLFDIFDSEFSEYIEFSNDLEFEKKFLGKKYDLYEHLNNKNFTIETIYQFDEYFIVYYYDEDYNPYCSVVDSEFNNIIIVEDVYVDSFYAYIYDDLIYFINDDKTIDIYKIDGTKVDSIKIQQDFLENDELYICDSYDLIFFYLDGNDLVLYYGIERCAERFVINNENDYKDKNKDISKPIYIMLKYSLNYEIEKIESSNGSFTYENKYDEEGKTFVELKIEPKEGYVVDKIIVTDLNGNKVEVIDNKFYMPLSDVKIEVQYKMGEYLPIPDTFLGKSITLILIGLVLISLGFYTINYVRQE